MRANVRMRHRQDGFTLIEAGIATMVVGIGIVALVHSLGAGTNVNHQGQNITQAVFVAQEVREYSLTLPFRDKDTPANPPGPDADDTEVDDLDDLMGATFSPPIDGQGKPIDNMAGWTQAVSLQWRDPNSLTSTVPNGSSDSIYVTVTITRNDQQVLQTSWLVSKRTP